MGISSYSAYEFVVSPARTVGFDFLEISSVLGGTIGADATVGATFIVGGHDLTQYGANPSGCLFTYDPNARFTFVFIPLKVIGFDFVEINNNPATGGTGGTIGTDATIGNSFMVGGVNLEELGGDVNGCLFPVIPPIILPPPQTGGGKTPRKCGTWFDECLQDRADLVSVLDWGKAVRTIPRCYQNPDPNCDIPLTGQQLRRQAAIPLPPDDGLDHLLFEWTVPDGYTAIITDHTQLFTGSGFNEADGLLNWRMRIDTWWVKNMGNMNTSRGSLNYLFPIPQGIILNSGQTFGYYVNLAVGGAVSIVGGKVIAGINGWFYSVEELQAGQGLPFNRRALSRYYQSQRYKDRMEQQRHGKYTI